MSRKKSKAGPIVGGLFLLAIGAAIIAPDNEHEAQPTPTPTEAATVRVISADPTPSPSPKPTATPTAAPTHAPEPTPTPPPEATPAPTTAPTVAPTPEPTPEPTPKDERLLQLVYTTPSGSCYHDPDCGTIVGKKLKEWTIEAAIAKGYKACDNCKPYYPEG